MLGCIMLSSSLGILLDEENVKVSKTIFTDTILRIGTYVKESGSSVHGSRQSRRQRNGFKGEIIDANHPHTHRVVSSEFIGNTVIRGIQYCVNDCTHSYVPRISKC